MQSLHDVQLLHVVALPEKHRILLTVYLPADQTGVHNTPVDQREETPVPVPRGLLIEVEVRGESGDLSVQRLQLGQVIQDRQEGGPDPHPVLILVGPKVLHIDTAHLAQRAPLQGLEVLERPLEVIVERRHLERIVQSKQWATGLNRSPSLLPAGTSPINNLMVGTNLDPAAYPRPIPVVSEETGLCFQTMSRCQKGDSARVHC